MPEKCKAHQLLLGKLCVKSRTVPLVTARSEVETIVLISLLPMNAQSEAYARSRTKCGRERNRERERERKKERRERETETERQTEGEEEGERKKQTDRQKDKGRENRVRGGHNCYFTTRGAVLTCLQ